MEQKTLQQLRQVRIEKLNKLREMGINPYPSKTPDFISTNSAKSKKPDESVAIVGRIMAMRGHGKIFFMDLFDGEEKLQCFFEENTLHDKIKLIEFLDIGDFLHVEGELFLTQAGELTVKVDSFTLLSKSIRPLPDKFHGLTDEEERYRKRYLDFIFNKASREKIKIRAKVLSATRDFMNANGFLEVETPVLENSASGALAKPFKTHINAYDMDIYLRICMGELWQKKLMVAQFEKTYEIGRAYRNEGVDREHNPEFTMMEYYWSFADYEKNMDFQEKLIAEVVFKVMGEYAVKNNENTIDFTPPYPRVAYRQLFKDKLQIDIDSMTKVECFEYARTNKVDVKKEWGKGKLLDEIYKTKIRPFLIQPMFLIDHPVELKPLAKRTKNPNYVESFQLLASGFELSNNYSELNDPMDQESRFDEQQEVKKHSDEEVMEADESFVEAMEHGMPPVSGAGIGIDRLVALLTNSHTLRETIAFPLMKPEAVKAEKYDYRAKKIVAVIDSNLPIGQAFNALGHLAFASGRNADDSWMGTRVLFDKDGIAHIGNAKYPFIILKANKEEIKELISKAKEKGIFVVDFPKQMYEMGEDEDLVKAIKKVENASLIYFAAVLLGTTEELKTLTSHLSLYK